MPGSEKPDALAEIEAELAWIAGAGLGHSMLKMSERAKRCLTLLPRLREVVEAARVLTKQQWTGKPDEYRPVDPRAMCALTLDLALKFVMLEGGPDA